MSLEEAIKTALEYESKVKKVYIDASEKVGNETGRGFFTMMADEEQAHMDYLRQRLNEWKNNGKIEVRELKSIVPDKETIKKQITGLKEKLKSDNTGSELRLLGRANTVEEETSNFYKQMVNTLDDQGKEMFSRFVEIEEGHLAVVEAQIDAIGNSGYWFDVNEFNMEGG
ncbi:MAG: ferritin family protein [bacterium]